ncbi:MAG: VWA domain-containing protein [Trueperaceae bacterium]|nr:VWA domain-containing protein [Trueperaceae bacterium]
MSMHDSERLKRWRLVLGGHNDATGISLAGTEARLDSALESLYGEGADLSKRSGGMGKSQPKLARWLGDIREFFPGSVVKVLQKDAFERHNLRQLLLEPEMMEGLEPDVHLAADLLALKDVMPRAAKETARTVIGQIVEDLKRRLEEPMRAAITGSLNRSLRNNRPRHNEIDWNRTIRANLKHYQPEYKSIIPERRIGFERKRGSLKNIVLCVDQSGSMGTSVVYSGVFGAVLASLPAIDTRMVVFDTAVVDLSEQLSDPVDLLFGVQLGGGTDINRALAYCQSVIEQPADTILVLVSDLYEGGNAEDMLRRASALVAAGVQMIALLALSDDGRPSFDQGVAQHFASLGIPSFACTPDKFAELMAAAIKKEDIALWAAKNDIVTSVPAQ